MELPGGHRTHVQSQLECFNALAVVDVDELRLLIHDADWELHVVAYPQPVPVYDVRHAGQVIMVSAAREGVGGSAWRLNSPTAVCSTVGGRGPVLKRLWAEVQKCRAAPRPD